MDGVGADRGVCPTPVERAAMVQWWDDLTFLHFRFPPEVVRPLVHPELTVETASATPAPPMRPGRSTGCGCSSSTINSWLRPASRLRLASR